MATFPSQLLRTGTFRCNITYWKQIKMPVILCAADHYNCTGTQGRRLLIGSLIKREMWLRPVARICCINITSFHLHDNQGQDFEGLFSHSEVKKWHLCRHQNRWVEIWGGDYHSHHDFSPAAFVPAGTGFMRCWLRCLCGSSRRWLTATSY